MKILEEGGVVPNENIEMYLLRDGTATMGH